MPKYQVLEAAEARLHIYLPPALHGSYHNSPIALFLRKQFTVLTGSHCRSGRGSEEMNICPTGNRIWVVYPVATHLSDTQMLFTILEAKRNIYIYIYIVINFCLT
jgi:hypothetical protein